MNRSTRSRYRRLLERRLRARSPISARNSKTVRSAAAGLDERIAAAAGAMSAVGHALAGRVQALANSLFVLRKHVPQVAANLVPVERDLDNVRKAFDRLVALPDAHRLPAQRLVCVGDLIDASLSQIAAPPQRLAVHITGRHLRLALDGAQVAAAIRELVRNGLETAPSTHVTLGVTASDAHLAIAVDDNGPSRWPDPVETAFDPFFTTKGGSLGLGLAIARTVALGHGGSLSILPRETGTLVLFEVRSCHEPEMPIDHG